MKKLAKSKKKKLLSELKKYSRKYLSGKYAEAGEAGTRLMLNDFLEDVLNYASLDEIKTEYMIRGTYADYVIQIKGKRHFVVEAKGISIELSPKHLRQVINYAANEGIDWAILTNGKVFELYKIIFSKPIDAKKIFSLDLSKKENLKQAAECFQYLTRELLLQRGPEYLWSKTTALDVKSFARFFYAKPIINNLRRQLKKICRNKFSDDEIIVAITRVIEEKIENVIPIHRRKRRKKKEINGDITQEILPQEIVAQVS